MRVCEGVLVGSWILDAKQVIGVPGVAIEPQKSFIEKCQKALAEEVIGFNRYVITSATNKVCVGEKVYRCSTPSRE